MSACSTSSRFFTLMLMLSLCCFSVFYLFPVTLSLVSMLEWNMGSLLSSCGLCVVLMGLGHD